MAKLIDNYISNEENVDLMYRKSADALEFVALVNSQTSFDFLSDKYKSSPWIKFVYHKQGTKTVEQVGEDSTSTLTN